MYIQGVPGPVLVQDGSQANLRAGRLGELIGSALHGRFYEQVFRGNVFCGGISTLTSVNNTSFTINTLTSSCTPIAGIWNPNTSGVNVIILSASVGITVTASTATTGLGPFAWAASTGNSVITTGNTPVNRKTLAKSGAQAKDMSNVALTGLTTNLTVLFGAQVNAGSAEGYSFTPSQIQAQSVSAPAFEVVDGSIIIPPGGVIALLGTTIPVLHSAVSSITWEEVPTG